MTSRWSDRSHEARRLAAPRHAALVFLLATVALYGGCFEKSGAERWACPADGVIRADSGLCNCNTEGTELMVSGWGKPCGACDAQDGNGAVCACDDGALLTNDFVTCISCPQDCSAIECVPPGCALGCAAECPGGSTCSATGTCLTCEPGMCGGSCGACPYGEVCADGLCITGILCCLSENKGAPCSEGADFCIVPPAPSSPGSPCYCNVQNHDEISSCQATFTGFSVGPGETCD